MACRPKPPPSPNPFISFPEPTPSGDDHLIRITFDTHSKRWGFENATVGALKHLEPFWGDASSVLWVHGGIIVPHMPSNARITGSPGYRARIDAGLYDMDQEQLQAEHAPSFRRSNEQARHTAMNFDIPVGQQVHAFREAGEDVAGSQKA